ncbi:hypothetical protein CERZMDRAFT_86468 [Cercospora zeae-maydis SCOH1-5]|uniref:Uncharacterized protein n=1 Tax=Cercospora zeae-maydis SCOH1-5 TaxID=717836 RepID=A0A6A6F9T8_9PEZI|nr:hypothetical protein CERZMDRAFT_86468 [Cercospora zeae-maydis SCOH1-5]
MAAASCLSFAAHVLIQALQHVNVPFANCDLPDHVHPSQGTNLNILPARSSLCYSIGLVFVIWKSADCAQDLRVATHTNAETKRAPKNAIKSSSTSSPRPKTSPKTCTPPTPSTPNSDRISPQLSNNLTLTLQPPIARIEDILQFPYQLGVLATALLPKKT